MFRVVFDLFQADDNAVGQFVPIFGLNSARLYRINLKAADARPMPAYSEDKLTQLKKEYEFAAKEPSNLRYGYVRAG